LEACKVKSAEPAKDNAAAGKRPWGQRIDA
jgi:hypothetical protein